MIQIKYRISEKKKNQGQNVKVNFKLFRIQMYFYKNTQEKNFLDFTSENKECYNEPFTLDELSHCRQSIDNSLYNNVRAPLQFLQERLFPHQTTKAFFF